MGRASGHSRGVQHSGSGVVAELQHTSVLCAQHRWLTRLESRIGGRSGCTPHIVMVHQTIDIARWDGDLGFVIWIGVCVDLWRRCTSRIVAVAVS